MKKLQLLPVIFMTLMVLVGCGSVDITASSPEPTAAVSSTPEPTLTPTAEPTLTPEPTPTPTAEPTSTPTPTTMTTTEPISLPEPTPESVGEFSCWQDAYIYYIENNSRDEYGNNSYCLIYLDDDDIPEMLDFGVSEADGTRVIVYNNGSFVENQMSRLSVKYIPGGNLLLNNEGNMGYYTANVYSIIDGVLTKIAGGTQSEDMEASERDSNGYITTFHFKCTWNGETVTEDEYAANLNAAFDSSRAVTPYPPYDESEMEAQGYYHGSRMIDVLSGS